MSKVELLLKDTRSHYKAHFIVSIYIVTPSNKSFSMDSFLGSHGGLEIDHICSKETMVTAPGQRCQSKTG